MKDIAVNPGNRRHVVQIQQQSSTPDTTTGAPATAWGTIRTTWASILTAGAKQATEQYQQGQFVAQVSHIINVRWTASPEILGGMRVVFGTHTYLIQTVNNIEVRDISIDLLCLEMMGVSE